MRKTVISSATPRLPINAKTGKLKRRSSITKNAYYPMLLNACGHSQLRFRYMLNDVWYMATENNEVHPKQLRQHFVIPLKADRKVALSQAGKQRARMFKPACLNYQQRRRVRFGLEK